MDDTVMQLLKYGREQLAALRAAEDDQTAREAANAAALQTLIEGKVLEVLPDVVKNALIYASVLYEGPRSYGFRVHFDIPGLAPIHCRVAHWVADRYTQNAELNITNHEFKFDADHGFRVPNHIEYNTVDGFTHSFYYQDSYDNFLLALAHAEEREAKLQEKQADEIARQRQALDLVIENPQPIPPTPAQALQDALYNYIVDVISDVVPTN